MTDRYDPLALRERMVAEQIRARGIRSPLVLAAMRTVAREPFVPEPLRAFAYDDSPQPIAEGQSLSPPHIVALMIDAAQLSGGEKVLEIGTGSGYSAAVLAHIAGEVYTMERLPVLAREAAANLSRLGYANVRVRHGDGTLGWPEAAPFDAIVVAASSPDVPPSLKSQLKAGGRLIIPVGVDLRTQDLLRITRLEQDTYRQEVIAEICLAPLLGQEGWPQDNVRFAPARRGALEEKNSDRRLAPQVADCAEPFTAVGEPDLDAMLRRIGDARVVLLGEASCGTSEFYRLRACITRRLIERKGFTFIAVDGDWSDLAPLDRHVRCLEDLPPEWATFATFPQWRWRNRPMREFVDWLRDRNAKLAPSRRVGLHGLDLYSLHGSTDVILRYLETIDPATAKIARERYGCLTPWQTDPAAYERAALNDIYQECEKPVVRLLSDQLGDHERFAGGMWDRPGETGRKARLLAEAERYYRTLYYGSRAAWVLRDQHMFRTLKDLLARHGRASKAIVWAHNVHIGNLAATEMASGRARNLGQLCRASLVAKCYAIGLGAGNGTVAAASEWGGPMEIKTLRPGIAESYEGLFRATGLSAFSLNLKHPAWMQDGGLSRPRLQRAIGAVYQPERELASHYFQAQLFRQFDEFLWIDNTHALEPLV